MAKCPLRLAATGVGLALLLGLSTARAGEPRSGRKATARHGGKSHAAPPETRRSVAGGAENDDASAGGESPELRALREAERELFPPPGTAQGGSWPSDLPLVVPGEATPRVHATGLPPEPSAPVPFETSGDLSWLNGLELPDLPVRWDGRVVRYLELFKDDPRGHAMFARLFRHSGRWRDLLRSTLRDKSLPEDLVWVAMIESGFDAAARSSAGAVGMWQFMPETAKIYGLEIDRWLDQRMSAQLETAAAADFLADLHRRFGSWDLALAAYNMGYAGLTSVIRRYNTNDFWSLARTEGTLPWETTLYVPKILAAAVIAHNLGAFGFADVQLDPAVDTDEIQVPPGTTLTLVAQAAGCSVKDVDALNPELRAGRTPPAAGGDAAFAVKLPRGKAAAAAQALARMRAARPPLDRYVVRFGETLDQIAASHKTTTQKLVDLNAIAPGEAVRGGTVLLVPHGDVSVPTAAAAPGVKPAVVVPAEEFVYPDRKHVFYRVQAGDTLAQVAALLHVSPEDLDCWNDVDPGSRLQEGMTLQAFVPLGADLSHVVVATEDDVRVVPVGSEEFFAALEHERGFHRLTVAARAGDTLESIGKRYRVSAPVMERVNRRGRAEPLREGEAVVVYAPSLVSGGSSGATASNAPAPNGPLPPAPLPDLLP